ncbi:MAG: hypothetical protein R3321_00085 [Nitrososphaeraceae archaeon]|nr:hypothetical protein [Nitrososphaeraceae archaeon]
MLTTSEKIALHQLRNQYPSVCCSALLNFNNVQKQLESYGDRAVAARAYLRRI